MDMVLKLDEGDILQREQHLFYRENNNSARLFHRLSYLGASLLSEYLEDLINQRLKKIPRSSEGIIYAPMLSRTKAYGIYKTLGICLH